ncbi:cyclophilin-like fold protein [Streptomyces ardesiacus]
MQSRRPRPGLLAPAHPRPEDFQGTERIADPPRELTTENAPEPTAAKAGDLAYYAPLGQTSPSSARTAPPPPRTC